MSSTSKSAPLNEYLCRVIDAYIEVKRIDKNGSDEELLVALDNAVSRAYDALNYEEGEKARIFVTHFLLRASDCAFRLGKKEEAVSYAERRAAEAAKLSELYGKRLYEAHSYLMLSQKLQFIEDRLEEALEWSDKAIEVSKCLEKDDKFLLFRSYFLKAHILTKQGRLKDALDIYFRFDKLAGITESDLTEVKPVYYLARSHYMCADIALDIEYNDYAESEVRECIRLLENFSYIDYDFKDLGIRAEILLGKILTKQKRYTEATATLSSALAKADKLAEKTSDVYLKVSAYSAMGDLALEEGDRKQAKSCFTLAKETVDRLGNKLNDELRKLYSDIDKKLSDA